MSVANAVRNETFFYPEVKDLFGEFKILQERGQAVCLTGEAGVGKSFAIHVYASVMRHLDLGSGFWQANITRSTDIRVLIGKMYPHSNGHLDIRWQDGDLTLAVRAGGLFLADELNRGAGEVQNRIFSLTESGYRYLTLPEKGNEIVDVPKDFQFIATQNPPNSKYYNAPLDRALSERFVHYNITKPLANESKMADAILPEPKFGKLAEQYYNIAVDSRKHESEIGMSTRSLRQVCDLTAHGFNKFQSLNVAYVNRLEEEADKQAARDVITTHFIDDLQGEQSFTDLVQW